MQTISLHIENASKTIEETKPISARGSEDGHPVCVKESALRERNMILICALFDVAENDSCVYRGDLLARF